jgi:hypothetical protein
VAGPKPPESSSPAAASAVDPRPAEPYVVGVLVLAGVLVAFCTALRALRRRERPDVGHIVGIVAPTAAITAGVRLAISAEAFVPFVSEASGVDPARWPGVRPRLGKSDL